MKKKNREKKKGKWEKMRKEKSGKGKEKRKMGKKSKILFANLFQFLYVYLSNRKKIKGKNKIDVVYPP